MASTARKPAQPAEARPAATTPTRRAARPTARLADAAADGTATFVLLRKSGRTRHVPYLPAKSTERRTAVALRKAWQGGTALAAVAEAHEMSVPTVRRRLLALALSEAVDAGKLDAQWKPGQPTVTFTAAALGGAE